MREPDVHLSDRELVLAADGELSTSRERHLAACGTCRARLRDLERAVADFAGVHRGTLDPLLPRPDAPRARLRARLAEAASGKPSGRQFWFRPWHAAAAGALALILTVGVLSLYQWRWSRANGLVDVPSPRLTPGAARKVDREELCNSALPKNQVVPADLRRRVFQAYGMANADPRAYEVDYLITPALGGDDDIRNLWPQPYVSTVWNARVKDALEDRLRDMVCRGQLDLAEAQRDISTDWIAAYKKYFQTNVPQ
jgi:hypothetical protein